MSHAIDFHVFKVGTKKEHMREQIIDAIAYQHDYGINGETGCPWADTASECFDGVRWEENRVFDTQEEAEKYLDNLNGWYVQRAVKFKRGERSKATQNIQNKLSEAYKALNDARQKINVFDIKSEFLGCKKCGSKISTVVMKGKHHHNNECPICGNDLRSATILNSLARKQEKVDALEIKFNESKKKDDAKGNLYWVIKTEYHC